MKPTTTRSAGTEACFPFPSREIHQPHIAMTQDRIEDIRENYDRIADEYARRMFRELDGKPFDREQLMRLANSVDGPGAICDIGCGPGQVALFLRDAGTD